MSNGTVALSGNVDDVIDDKEFVSRREFVLKLGTNALQKWVKDNLADRCKNRATCVEIISFDLGNHQSSNFEFKVEDHNLYITFKSTKREKGNFSRNNLGECKLISYGTCGNNMMMTFRYGHILIHFE